MSIVKHLYGLVFLMISSQALAAVEPGELPPSFLGNTPDGKPVELSQRKGKVVVATFWASWCGPCLQEMKVLEGIQRQVGKDQLEIVAINFHEPPRRYRAIVRKLKDFQVTFTHDAHGAISDRYGVKALPNMFIVNKNGLVVEHHLGYNPDGIGELVDELNKLMSDPAPKT
ncbi:TlpA disulfide reductase family protein [Gallaecimonas pentaromativorans]